MRRLYASILMHFESPQLPRVPSRPRHIEKRQLSARERTQPNNVRFTNNARISSVIGGAILQCSSIIISNSQSFLKYALIHVT